MAITSPFPLARYTFIHIFNNFKEIRHHLKSLPNKQYLIKLYFAFMFNTKSTKCAVLTFCVLKIEKHTQISFCI